jgi:hypothetical protein
MWIEKLEKTLFTQKKPHHLFPPPKRGKNCKYIIKIDRKTQKKAEKRGKKLLRKTYLTKNRLQTQNSQNCLIHNWSTGGCWFTLSGKMYFFVGAPWG